MHSLHSSSVEGTLRRVCDVTEPFHLSDSILRAVLLCQTSGREAVLAKVRRAVLGCHCMSTSPVDRRHNCSSWLEARRWNQCRLRRWRVGISRYDCLRSAAWLQTIGRSRGAVRSVRRAMRRRTVLGQWTLLNKPPVSDVLSNCDYRRSVPQPY